MLSPAERLVVCGQWEFGNATEGVVEVSYMARRCLLPILPTVNDTPMTAQGAMVE